MTNAEKSALEAELSTLTDQDILRRLDAAPIESEEFEIIVGEAERRNLDG